MRNVSIECRELHKKDVAAVFQSADVSQPQYLITRDQWGIHHRATRVAMLAAAAASNYANSASSAINTGSLWLTWSNLIKFCLLTRANSRPPNKKKTHYTTSSLQINNLIVVIVVSITSHHFCNSTMIILHLVFDFIRKYAQTVQKLKFPIRLQWCNHIFFFKFVMTTQIYIYL